MSGIVGYSLKGVDVEVNQSLQDGQYEIYQELTDCPRRKGVSGASEEERRAVLERWYRLLAEEQLRKAQPKERGKRKHKWSRIHDVAGYAQVLISMYCVGGPVALDQTIGLTFIY